MTTASEDGLQDIKDNWKIILAAGICMFFMFGIPTYVLPWVARSVAADFEWSRSQATDIASMKFLVGSLFAVAIGWGADRLGPRRITIAACLVGGVTIGSIQHHWYQATSSQPPGSLA